MVKDSSSTINLRLILPGSKNKDMKLKRIKTNTVHIRRPLFVGKNKTNSQPIPLISISGKILDYYGFEIGRLFDVYARKKFLILIARKFKYKKRIES